MMFSEAFFKITIFSSNSSIASRGPSVDSFLCTVRRLHRPDKNFQIIFYLPQLEEYDRGILHLHRLLY